MFNSVGTLYNYKVLNSCEVFDSGHTSSNQNKLRLLMLSITSILSCVKPLCFYAWVLRDKGNKPTVFIELYHLQEGLTTEEIAIKEPEEPKRVQVWFSSLHLVLFFTVEENFQAFDSNEGCWMVQFL